MRTWLVSSAAAMMVVWGLCGAAAEGSPASPSQNDNAEKAQQSRPGRAGAAEPGAQHPTPKPEDSATFINGRLAVPGAPADSQTVPAKFSKRNAALDASPVMAFPLALNDDQRQRIREAVSMAPVANAQVQPSDYLPRSIELRALPSGLENEIPALRNLGFVRTDAGILLVTSLQRIVVETF